jgi:hypothetical protein
MLVIICSNIRLRNRMQEIVVTCTLNHFLFLTANQKNRTSSCSVHARHMLCSCLWVMQSHYDAMRCQVRPFHGCASRNSLTWQRTRRKSCDLYALYCTATTNKMASLVYSWSHVKCKDYCKELVSCSLEADQWNGYTNKKYSKNDTSNKGMK